MKPLKRATPFVNWLFTQANVDHPVGDLARDCRADPNFPRMGTNAEIREYLSRYGDLILAAFDSADEEWLRRCSSPPKF